MLLIDYNTIGKTFTCLDEDDILVNCHFLFSDKNKKGVVHDVSHINNFSFKQLHKHKIPENEIRQAYIKANKNNSTQDTRIGWIIPVSALISEDHDYKDDIHFGYYAFYAYAYLLKDKEVQAQLKDGKGLSEIINNLYVENNDSVLFICENNNLPIHTTLDCFEISLYQYGYYRKYKEVNSKCKLIESSIRINLVRTSDVFFSDKYNDEYIESFIEELVFEDNQKIRFFLLYQFVEIFIDDIMITQLTQQLDDYKIGKTSTRGLDMSLKVNTELMRIKKMMELSHISKNDYRDLHNICNNYLISKGHDSVDFPESL